MAFFVSLLTHQTNSVYSLGQCTNHYIVEEEKEQKRFSIACGLGNHLLLVTPGRFSRRGNLPVVVLKNRLIRIKVALKIFMSTSVLKFIATMLPGT